eukprot:3465859-Alexandrium_andersonii.AAC.1
MGNAGFTTTPLFPRSGVSIHSLRPTSAKDEVSPLSTDTSHRPPNPNEGMCSRTHTPSTDRAE